MCGFMINGVAHGPKARHHSLSAPHAPLQRRRRAVPRALARASVSGSKGFGSDRGAFDRIIAAGGFISAPTGSAVDGNAILVPKPGSRNIDGRPPLASAVARALRLVRTQARRSFTAAKVTHLGVLPQGQPERNERALNMVAAANREQFGSCTNIGECEAVCPKLIPLEVIARMNRDYIRASWSKTSLEG